jgi:phosphoserine aminotransferase
MERRNRAKAARLYSTIDALAGFYRAPVELSSRSTMNVVFRLPTAELDEQFVAEAKKAGMVGLKGHRLTGGIRVSTYNAVSERDVETLTGFMRQFAQTNG